MTDPREIAQRILERLREHDPIVIRRVDHKDILDILTSSLAAEMPRWVPVEEKLPRGQAVWVIINGTIQHHAMCYSGEGWEWAGSDQGWDRPNLTDVTHWLDGVPSPPREEAP